MGLTAGDATFGLPEQPPPGSPKSSAGPGAPANSVGVQVRWLHHRRCLLVFVGLFSERLRFSGLSPLTYCLPFQGKALQEKKKGSPRPAQQQSQSHRYRQEDGNEQQSYNIGVGGCSFGQT
jgi:hypothetical protein